VSNRGPRPKPKRLFKARRLPAAVVVGIDLLTAGNPELRSLLLASVPAINTDAFLTAFAIAPPHTRASMVLAFRDAVFGLRDGLPCDYCPRAKAAHVRFLSVPRSEYSRVVTPKPGQESLIGFAIVCPSCARLTEPELACRMVNGHAGALRQAAETPCRRHVVLGSRIGEAGSLPRRHALQTCEDCAAMVWTDQDETDRLAGETPLYLCRPCAGARAESGGLEAVPMFLLGGPS
jgi:hypothetical protein